MRKFFFAKILRMTKYTSLPNLVRLGQWEQVSEYYYIQSYIHTTHTTGENRARRTKFHLRNKISNAQIINTIAA